MLFDKRDLNVFAYMYKFVKYILIFMLNSVGHLWSLPCLLFSIPDFMPCKYRGHRNYFNEYVFASYGSENKFLKLLENPVASIVN
jgi:hypothetical protein